jgi:hypothetical protein
MNMMHLIFLILVVVCCSDIVIADMTFSYSGTATYDLQPATMVLTISGTTVTGTLIKEGVCKPNIRLTDTNLRLTGALTGEWEGTGTIAGNWTGGDSICMDQLTINDPPGWPQAGTFIITKEGDTVKLLRTGNPPLPSGWTYNFGATGKVYTGSQEWPKSAGGNGHYYEAVLVPGGITWDDANAAAEAKGGHLATITSAAENQFVYNLVAGDDRYWIFDSNAYGPWLGGYQPAGSPEPAGGWIWVTGESFSYTNWWTGEPNNGGSADVEESLHFIGGNTLQSPAWNDAPHDFSAKGYIVEYEV